MFAGLKLNLLALYNEHVPVMHSQQECKHAFKSQSLSCFFSYLAREVNEADGLFHKPTALCLFLLNLKQNYSVKDSLIHCSESLGSLASWPWFANHENSCQKMSKCAVKNLSLDCRGLGPIN